MPWATIASIHRMKDPHVIARKVVPSAAALGRVARAEGSASASAPSARAKAGGSGTRVLGIDPGTLRLGYGVVEHAGPGRLTYVECGVISAPATKSRVDRLGVIGEGLAELIAELKPHVVAIEEAFFGKNIQSTLALGEARGVSIFVASQAGLPIAGYAPAKVKNTVVGHGRATKEQIAYVVRALLSLRRAPEPDAADALAIAVCHARSFDFARRAKQPVAAVKPTKQRRTP
ncbi:MAG: crossover junction endodeoxyribonuclease RuvC [Deltaproteobacteria bacterium]|nr:crossover junction endodeoxyribonuclease RuvC [Deltaproteobacteria bacterium]